MWLFLDVTISGCDYFWMRILLDVNASGCDYFLSWKLDVTTSGFVSFWMWLLLDVTISGCDYCLYCEHVSLYTKAFNKKITNIHCKWFMLGDIIPYYTFSCILSPIISTRFTFSYEINNIILIHTFSCIHIFNGTTRFQGGGGDSPPGGFQLNKSD